MNILGLELEYFSTFHIIPHINLYFSASIYIHIYWLNFCLTIKHIGSNYSTEGLYFYSPSITLQSYLKSAYICTFEINVFNYIYKKGLFRNKDVEILPYDNTPGFVHSSWFNQFWDPIDFGNFIKEIEKHLKNKL